MLVWIWLFSDSVNEFKEFRTCLVDGKLGVFDSMNPSYTIFNKENKNFCVIWTEFCADYLEFLARYERDKTLYSSSTSFMPKANIPQHCFNISMLPWICFKSFDINVFSNNEYLLPIFTMGKYFMEGKKRLLPFAVQVHHAVCDGYHVAMFLERLQNKIFGHNSKK